MAWIGEGREVDEEKAELEGAPTMILGAVERLGALLLAAADGSGVE